MVMEFKLVDTQEVCLLAFLAFYIDFTFRLLHVDSGHFLMWICLFKMRFT